MCEYKVRRWACSCRSPQKIYMKRCKNKCTGEIHRREYDDTQPKCSTCHVWSGGYESKKDRERRKNR